MNECSRWTLAALTEFLRALEVSELPGAPSSVVGVFQMGRRVLPVVDLRRVLRLPVSVLSPRDRFVVVRTSTRSLALWVDSVGGIETFSPDEQSPISELLPGLQVYAGVIRLERSFILLADVEKILSSQEQSQLDEAMAGGPTA